MTQEHQPNTVPFSSMVKGGIFGLAVGDALGVPVEFMKRESIARSPINGMKGYGTHNQPLGTWSDDTSMALCILESITKTGWNIDDQAMRFVRWYKEAHLTAHDAVFDIGIATAQAIDRITAGYAPLEAGSRDENSNGNGSLMRSLPAAVYCAVNCDDEELVKEVANSSSITHAHPRSRLGCVIHAFITAELLKGKRIDAALIGAAKRVESVLESSILFSEMKQELQHYHSILYDNLELTKPSEIRSSGYVVDTLEAAVWCLLTSSGFEECVLKAVNLGDDTDTVGAVTGGLAGIYWGYESIPSEWIEALAKNEMIRVMAEEFITVLESQEADG
ncbi:ADP-ribosylglycohydrolase family protein [Marispirochaeta aestuarii]|uniref:ADP-ribosylglycohydrolase family protein n=1 Tax=Marispirochaeta aestuarii TaxID=1963862 RepID=UPI0029C90B18|nr:ADP-ribosylglycohydrolase family protein [Marispirochaeta aestuarii]